MIRIANGWYVDALPNGAWAALVKESHIDTSNGRVPLPGEQNLLYLRLHPGGVRFAGVGNRDDLVWEWMGDFWVSRGVGFGPRAVSYDAAGNLQVITGPPAAPTVFDIARQIWGHTELPGVTIGHGGKGPHGEDPCIALIDGTRRLIEEGQCRFINVTEKEGRISVAYVREDTHESVIRILTREAIRALPEARVQRDEPRNPTPPKPEPDPVPEPANLRADVEAERAKYPALLTHDQPAKILNAVAWKHRADGWGLSVKPGGNRVPAPQGVDVAYDILHHWPSNRLFDALTDDLKGTVTWGETSYHGDPVGRPWLAPIEPDGAVVVPTPPPPAPAPPSPTKNKDEIRAAIVELKRFYDDPDGLNRRARGIPSPVSVDDAAFWDWVALAVLEPIEQVKDRIRQFPEYKDQHPRG